MKEMGNDGKESASQSCSSRGSSLRHGCDASVSCCQEPPSQSAEISALSLATTSKYTSVLSVQGEPGVPGPKVRSCLYGKLWMSITLIMLIMLAADTWRSCLLVSQSMNARSRQEVQPFKSNSFEPVCSGLCRVIVGISAPLVPRAQRYRCTSYFLSASSLQVLRTQSSVTVFLFAISKTSKEFII